MIKFSCLMIKHRDELNLISFKEKNRLFGIFRIAREMTNESALC